MAKKPNFDNQRYSRIEIPNGDQTIGFQEGDVTTVVKDPKTGKPFAEFRTSFNFWINRKKSLPS